MNKNQTGIASEFWFFSQLQRLGYETYITLGNTKKVDITVKLATGEMFTFDVKGKMNFKGSFYLDNIDREKENHFVVFVNLEVEGGKGTKKTELIKSNPECFLIENSKLDYLAFNWVSSNGETRGYGFEAKLLWYLKYKQMRSITAKNINDFKQRHHITGEIDFAMYNTIILNLKDFEDQFYELK